MREHGTYAAYKLDSCRCYPCGLAGSNYRMNRTRALAYGTWQPWVNAHPVRTHILHLRDCGIGIRTLATHTGLARSTLTGIVNGVTGRAPVTKVRPATAAKILNIEPTLDNIADHTPIDASGTRRRLQALVAIGWSQQQLAERLGMSRGNFGAMLARPQVTANKARTVQDLYKRLWNADPAHHGAPACGITRALNQARTAGWAPPAAWDDEWLDLPDTELATELARRAAAMTFTETGRCYRAHHDGDPSPLIAAGAREHNRRRAARQTARKATAA